MSSQSDSVNAKVVAIFREWAAERADRLIASNPATELMGKLLSGLAADYPEALAVDISFHLADWNADAAFLVAVHLFPERFSAEEVATAVRGLLLHAPNHLVQAAKLSGHPGQSRVAEPHAVTTFRR